MNYFVFGLLVACCEQIVKGVANVLGNLNFESVKLAFASEPPSYFGFAIIAGLSAVVLVDGKYNYSMQVLVLTVVWIVTLILRSILWDAGSGVSKTLRRIGVERYKRYSFASSLVVALLVSAEYWFLVPKHIQVGRLHFLGVIVAFVIYSAYLIWYLSGLGERWRAQCVSYVHMLVRLFENASGQHHSVVENPRWILALDSNAMDGVLKIAKLKLADSIRIVNLEESLTSDLVEKVPMPVRRIREIVRHELKDISLRFQNEYYCLLFCLGGENDRKESQDIVQRNGLKSLEPELVYVRQEVLKKKGLPA